MEQPHLRADAIVGDAEAIRQELGVEKWSLLGQSFGGFCVVTYLSFFGEALNEAFLTGGLPPVARPTEEVYRATYVTVRERNRRRYPGDPGRSFSKLSCLRLRSSGRNNLRNG